MTIDLGVLYRGARERITTLVAAGDVPDALVVPATPDWTVHDVVAHVVGVAEDAATGNMAGAPGDAWTAAQVARGAGGTISELLAGWAQHGPALEGFLSGPGGGMAAAAAMDVHCHEADLRHALGLPSAPPAEFLAWAGPSMRDRFEAQVAEAGLRPLALEISDLEWFRGRLGRRTEAEVAAYPWPVAAEPYLDLFFIFGRAATSLGETGQSGDAT
ncbi:MAG: maleylpyruvate isomerase family mycothiol-dependent enzyme [Actinomycetota bacterium]|nr:maleylpyruvate isomerase family mycothiol-dependent enzyme [Actinomycetota bacterium]